MAKHFNQPLPAVPTFKKKKKGGGGMPRFIKKVSSKDQPWFWLWAETWEVGKGRAEGVKVKDASA